MNDSYNIRFGYPKRHKNTVAKADCKCLWCGYRVPKENLNKFYCGSSCMSDAWNYYNPSKDEYEEEEYRHLHGIEEVW